MPDTDSPSPSGGPSPSASSEQGPSADSPRNLPVPVPSAGPLLRPNGEGWFSRALRMLFGWKPDQFRSDLRTVLEAGRGDIGFSQRESVMLRNILGLRERQAADLMVPRTDIVAVKKEIPLGEL